MNVALIELGRFHRDVVNVSTYINEMKPEEGVSGRQLAQILIFL